MRSGASAVQHLLSQAALGVLKHAVTEARRRGHPQVQPLHVVSMLLTHAGSRLRQACMLSHAQTAQTAECRALEVCFNVALDHLPQSAMAAASQPILSNALMAALKRAHAHQRRGCPEHQHSPLLAVKVEIDQLIISILDDPCVSRVMKEAGFSSTNVKVNLEDGPTVTVSSAPPPPAHEPVITSQGVSFYDNNSCVIQEENETKSSVKSWQQQQQQTSEVVEGERREVVFRGATRVTSFPSREEDIHNIVEILLAPRNRNALLIGDSTVGANSVVEDLAFRIKSGTVPVHLKGLQFLDPKLSLSSFSLCSSLEMEQKLAELSKIVEECMPVGAILHIGDLQWLAEPMQLKKGPSNFCPAQRTATELRNLLVRHANNRLWFVGVVTPHTFTRLQVLYPSLASEWNLQPVQVTTTTTPFQHPPQPTFLQRFSSNLQTVNDQQAALNSLPVRASSPIVTTSVVQDSRHLSHSAVTQRSQCCPDCVSKLEEERRQIHENESLSLQLAPIKWLPPNDEVTSGGSDGAISQTKNPSVVQQLVQQLAQLEQKWQKFCRTQHGEPTLVSTRPQLQSPLSRLSASSHSKPCGLGLDMSAQWSSIVPQDRHKGSSVVDQPLRTPPPSSVVVPMYVRDQTQRATTTHEAVTSSTVGGGGGGANAKPAEATSSPKDGSSVASAPGDHDDPNGSTGTSAQDASLASVQTNLALGRAIAVGSNLMASQQQQLRAPAKPLMQPSPLQSLRNKPVGASPLKCVGASPMASLKPGKPGWLTQSPLQSLQQRRPATLASWQSSPSPLSARRQQTDITKASSPPPMMGLKEMTVDDTLKGLYKGLMQRVPWQAAAVAGISATVMNCRSSGSGFRGQTAKTDTWLLLLGPDPVAKHSIAKALAELVFGGERSLIHLGFADGSRAKLEADDSGVRFRARTPLDRLAEAVRLKPSAVILLEDIDKADSVMRSRIMKAMEIGKLADLNGREVSFGNTIVVMTSSVGSNELLNARPGNLSFSETKLAGLTGRAGIHAKIKHSRSEKVVFEAPNTKLMVVDYETPPPPPPLLPSPLPPSNSSPYHSPAGGKLPPWVQKRKSESLLSVELRSKNDVKRMKSSEGRFLNLDLNLATGGGDASEGNCWTGESQSPYVGSDDHASSPTDEEEEDEHQKLLSKARSALSVRFCDLPDYAVGFEPYDFNGLATEILTKLGKALEVHAPREVALELDRQLLDYIITCVWKIPGGHQAFNSWVEDVFVKSLSDNRLCGGASVVELLLELPQDVVSSQSGVALPRRIEFES